MITAAEMTATALKDGGWTVGGGGEPGSFPGGRESVDEKPPAWAVHLQKTADRNARMLERIGKMLAEGRHLRDGAGPSSPATPQVAPDRELDTERGNFRVKKDPKQWTGESFVGRLLSECTPEFLDVLADAKDWKAQKEDEDAAALTGAEQAQKRKYAGFSRKDAARARGWASRLRGGWKPPASEEDKGDDDSW